MKALSISITLFCVLITVIIVNSIFVNNTAKKIDDIADEIVAASDQNNLLNELDELWRERKNLLGLSISTDQLDTVTNTIIFLNEAVASKNEYDIRKYSALLSDCAHNIKRTEAISIENIL